MTLPLDGVALKWRDQRIARSQQYRDVAEDALDVVDLLTTEGGRSLSSGFAAGVAASESGEEQMSDKNERNRLNGRGRS